MFIHAMCKSCAALTTALTCLFMVAPAAMGAAITWSPARDVASAADIDVSGILIEAINASGAGLSATVNGVSFLASDALLDQSFGGDTLAGASSGDVALDRLIGSFDYGNGATTSLGLGGGLLVPGDAYVIQVFFTDLRGCCSARDMTIGDGLGSDVDLNATGSGLGQFVLGTFQASAATQPLSLAANGFSNAHITGYQIRAIPEPGTGMLVALGLALAASRRKRAGLA